MSNPTDQAEVLRSEKEVLLTLLSGPAGDAAAGSLWDAAGDEALLGLADQLDVALADLLKGGRVRPQLALGSGALPAGASRPTERLEQRRLSEWGSSPEAHKRLGVVSRLRRGGTRPDVVCCSRRACRSSVSGRPAAHTASPWRSLAMANPPPPAEWERKGAGRPCA